MILQPFPQPALAVANALDRLDKARRTPGAITDTLPQPWEPTTCPDTLRRHVWTWCDQVALWVNHEYVWRPTQLIPACWPRHPHIARELAALASQRWIAEQTCTPERIEEWHHYTLPGFLDRMTSRLGESKCRDGTHQDWPAQPRYTAMLHSDGTVQRATDFTDDAPSA